MSKPSDFSPKGGAAELPGAPSTRQLRIGEEIRRTLAEIFTRTEFRDPDLHDVQITVTEVRVAPDLKHATVFVSRLGLGQSGVAPLLPALKRVAPWLRSQLAHKLRLRGVPELHFQSDESLDHAMEVDSLLRSPEVSRDLGHGQQFGQQNGEGLED